jgi:hypothetical protein
VIVFNDESLRRTLRPTLLITIDPVFISRWTKIHRIRVPCNRSAESSLFPKLVGCIIATNAPPESSLVNSLNAGARHTSSSLRQEIRYDSDRYDSDRVPNSSEASA